MSDPHPSVHVCTCNGTVALDAAALTAVLGAAEPVTSHTQLCRKELARFLGDERGDALVACTQEAQRFSDAAGDGDGPRSVRFVNVRERAGWSAQGRDAMPKIAALLAAASLPEPEPVPRVTYRSEGRLLIVGPAAPALAWAEQLAPHLAVSVLLTDSGKDATMPQEHRYPVSSGSLQRLEGWLGRFTATWSQDNPIDLERCVRCGACVAACPEDAIGWNLQVDLVRCLDHRACVVACGAIEAIDFARAERLRSEDFDLVLDLKPVSCVSLRDPPQGYFRGTEEPLAAAALAIELIQAVGEFEKPRYFNFKASLCAHSRSGQPGCNLCIETCSTGAIAAAGDVIAVEPHLCMGCGACTTVCPSGALTYAFPSAADIGLRLKSALSAFRATGGRDPCVLFHDAEAASLLNELARRGKGLPAHVIPFALHHMASVGLDVWLAAMAYGSTGVLVLATGREAPGYADDVERQMRYGNTILAALGYQGATLEVLRAGAASVLEPLVWRPARGLAVRAPAVFNLTPEKRTSLALALEHLARHAPTPVQTIGLDAGAPFGNIVVDRDRCTMCLACVGACPEGALVDDAERPRLRFIETRCVQCGICAATCPEDAITLEPRLSLRPEVREPRVLNEAVVFHCIRCKKAMGTEKIVGSMIARLAGHSMFSEPGALERLKMCADCRVLDMMRPGAPA